MHQFVDRKKELDTLSREYQRREASFVVIYGRRRIGKTALISEFCKDKRTIFFLATEENEEENRNAFKNTVADFAGSSLLKDAAVSRWEPVFDLIAQCCTEEDRLIVALDEFQYLGKANPAFPSVLMRIWDQQLKEKNIMLILSGSLIHMMEDQVLSYSSPLYGRRTAQMRIGPIAFRYYKDFAPGLSWEEQLLHYAVTGGVPKYIELFQDQKDIYAAIRDNIMSRSAFLYAEPEFLLQKEVSEVGSYFSVLKTIAAGNHKLGKIAAALNIRQTSLSKYLRVLADLDILEREVPVTEENPEKSKKGLYFIKDHFIKFWFQFIYPYRGLLEMDQDDFVMEKIRSVFIENHVSYVYEEVCRERMWELLSAGCQFNQVGRWWGDSDVEIDLVAYDSFGRDIYFGECKYSRNPKGMDVLRSLMEKSQHVNWNRTDRQNHYVLFSRSGYTDELKKRAEAGDVILL